jgi:hypothetical protein
MLTMRIDGRWHRFTDGFERPVIDAQLILPTGQLVPLSLLLDTGADFTVVGYNVAQSLSAFLMPQSLPGAVGVGGTAPIALLNAVLVFSTADGRQAGFRGPIQALAAPAAVEFSVLGRDIIDRFELVYSRPRGLIALVAPPHTALISP